MGVTDVERARRHRKKIKADKASYDEQCRKDRERKALQRKKQKEKDSPTQRLIKLEKDRQRKRESRARRAAEKKSQSTPSSSVPYKSAQSLGKAVHRATKTLPKSPTKKAQVIASIINTITPTKQKLVTDAVSDAQMKRKLFSTERKVRSDSISEDEIAAVVEFYERDDISRMCPGKKDYVSVKVDGAKIKKQKRLLIVNLSEAHHLFVQDSGMQIGLTKFCALRPKHVLPMTIRDQEVCMCKYHENINMLATGIHRVVDEIPASGEDVAKLTVCNASDEDCVSRDCEHCSVSKLDELFGMHAGETPVSYFQWVTGDGGVIEKQLIEESLADAQSELYSQLETFSRHMYDAKRQHVELRLLKDTLKPGQIIIHEDFAENFQLKQQNEIMQAHWSSNSVTIFTAIVYYKLTMNGELQHESFTIISDELGHDKFSVYAFNKVILDKMKDVLPWDIEIAHYWSDGAASQFKNRYNFVNLLDHEADHGCSADWSFFATAHGKGPIDGLGGEVKRQVWRAVLQGKHHVHDAASFAAAATILCPKIYVMLISKNDIVQCTQHLPERWSATRALPGTQRYHYLKPVTDVSIACGKNSVFSSPSAPLNMHQLRERPAEAAVEEDDTAQVRNDGNYKPGDFIYVELRGIRSVGHYVGQITCVSRDVIDVNFLRASGSDKTVFVYPIVEDKSAISMEQVVMKLPVPLMDGRGRYHFPQTIHVTQ